MESNKTQAVQGLALTVGLGVYFTILQGYEYVEALFSVADSVYGRTFFVATGFHGLYVIVGTTFLVVCLVRAGLGMTMKKITKIKGDNTKGGRRWRDLGEEITKLKTREQLYNHMSFYFHIYIFSILCNSIWFNVKYWNRLPGFCFGSFYNISEMIKINFTLWLLGGRNQWP